MEDTYGAHEAKDLMLTNAWCMGKLSRDSCPNLFIQTHRAEGCQDRALAMTSPHRSPPLYLRYPTCASSKHICTPDSVEAAAVMKIQQSMLSTHAVRWREARDDPSFIRVSCLVIMPRNDQYGHQLSLLIDQTSFLL